MVSVLDFVLLIITIVMSTICFLLLIDEFGPYILLPLIIFPLLSLIVNLAQVIEGMLI